MYAFNDSLPYAYVLILVKPTNLIPIYIYTYFYNCYSFKLKKSYL